MPPVSPDSNQQLPDQEPVPGDALVDPEQAAEVEVAEAVPETPTFSWQASEYIHHHKGFGWYLLFFILAGGLGGLAVWTHSYSGLVLLAVTIVAVLMFTNKPPRTLSYAIDSKGITIEDKFYGYDQFRSFGVVSDLAWHSIDLDPVKRFMPRLTILFDSENIDAIVSALTDRLPREDHQPDLIDRLSRALKF